MFFVGDIGMRMMILFRSMFGRIQSVVLVGFNILGVEHVVLCVLCCYDPVVPDFGVFVDC